MRRANFKRASRKLLSDLTVRVYRCNGCGHVVKNQKPSQCSICGRIDFTHIHSQAEAKRLAELELMQKAGLIKDLETQVRIVLKADGGAKVGEYVADFRYFDCKLDRIVVEDVKGGAIDPVASWKLRHYEAQFGEPVKLVRMT